MVKHDLVPSFILIRSLIFGHSERPMSLIYHFFQVILLFCPFNCPGLGTPSEQPKCYAYIRKVIRLMGSSLTFVPIS
jgi:hypothetical protein